MCINKGKIGIFIDGNNIFYNAQQLNIEIDYTKLLKYVCQKDIYSKAYFYGMLDNSNDKQQGFYTWLKYNGFKVILKYHNTNNFKDALNDTKRNNMDIDIVVDIMKYSSIYDTIIVIGATSDILPCLQYLQNKGTRVEFIGMKYQNLTEYVDTFIDLNDIKHLIGKQTTNQYEKYTQLIHNIKTTNE
jgi:uncharacterized LabA/DUF88 family protein